MSLFSKQKNMNFILIVIAAKEEAAGGDAGRLKEWSYFICFHFLQPFFTTSVAGFIGIEERCAVEFFYTIFFHIILFSVIVVNNIR